ncbi:arginase family protein [Salinibacterium soli]|uniref:Arginase family protein n=1 Tax=Antiquaquibacter soli TaxID=3064523 RepID=A0ABT9BSU0_9MICO|nr:arginase family protein [Protaetiibacter sp. WY-16]MDO7882866.1 arginase family protein [Protaetiibacter sp. WY-16]
MTPPVPALPHDPLWPRAGGWPAPVAGERADVAVAGIPTFRRSLSPTRADLTPAAVREALRRYSLDTELHIVDAGDATDPDAVDATDWVAAIDARVVIALGGDNSATVPVARGRGAAGLVTVDAHHDLRDGISNGSPVRELVELGMPGPAITQLGIEPLANSRAYRDRAHELGITVIERAELGITVIERAELGRRPIVELMTEAIDRAARFGPVHVDLDVDACDRSVAPGCPASVPGGISALELRAAARAAGGHPAVVSVDLTEVDAAADAPDGRTVRLMALCVLEVISGVAAR